MGAVTVIGLIINAIGILPGLFVVLKMDWGG